MLQVLWKASRSVIFLSYLSRLFFCVIYKRSLTQIKLFSNASAYFYVSKHERKGYLIQKAKEERKQVITESH
jgi:hypothetical protein